MPSLVIHLAIPCLVETASVLKGFYMSCLMGSYSRHQSYHDCPPRHWLSQQAPTPNPSNILRCHHAVFEGKTTTNPPRMCNPSESTRQCQTQTTGCVLAPAETWFSGWFRDACLTVIAVLSCLVLLTSH